MERLSFSKKNLDSAVVRDSYNRIFASLRNQTKYIHPFKTLLITSCHPKEGKTTVATGLAQYCSKLGFNTLLINAQTRHLGKEHAYGYRTTPGWVDFLAGEVDVEELLIPVKKNLSYVPVGHWSDEALRFLMTKDFEKMLVLLGKPFDLVLLDGPSLREGSDGFLMAAKTDGVVLVVQKGQTTIKELIGENARVQSSGTKWIGVVLNKL